MGSIKALYTPRAPTSRLLPQKGHTERRTPHLNQLTTVANITTTSVNHHLKPPTTSLDMYTTEEATFPPMEGRIIKTPLGRILLGRLLGQGSFGVVHEATMLKPDKYGHRQRYAVKCMSQFPAGSSMAALQDEEMYLHHMVSEHPNVVDIHGTVVDAREHLVFIVLELCTGGTLHERICDGVFLRGSDGADEKIKSVFGQLLDAVEHCHLKGVYHRDLKPGNVLIEGEGRAAQALLTDFGMASMQKRGTSLRYGTRQFWSPGMLLFCVGSR